MPLPHLLSHTCVYVSSHALKQVSDDERHNELGEVISAVLASECVHALMLLPMLLADDDVSYRHDVMCRAHF